VALVLAVGLVGVNVGANARMVFMTIPLPLLWFAA
jgi:hypothetical protein